MKRARLSAEAFLKSVEAQAEDQCKQLHITEIKLVTQKQFVLDLKAEMEKVMQTAWVASEAAEVEKIASYERGVLDTETRLAKEVAGVYRDYYAET